MCCVWYLYCIFTSEGSIYLNDIIICRSVRKELVVPIKEDEEVEIYNNPIIETSEVVALHQPLKSLIFLTDMFVYLFVCLFIYF